MTKGNALRDRTAAMIIDSAAALLADRGEASVEEIAVAAGIGRATLYRYFANRDELLRAMAAASLEELAVRIKEADLDAVPFDEAVARLTRAIVTTGNKYAALGRGGGRYSDAYSDVDGGVIEPIRALFRRGLADGSLRDNFPPDLLVSLFSGLVRGALYATDRQRGIEESAAAITSLFLHGVRAPRPSAGRLSTRT